MRAHFGLPSVRNGEAESSLLTIDSLADENDRRAPISVKFEIPYFTVSGIQVRYLKIVEKSGYQALPWVRYITQVSCKSRKTGARLIVQNGDDYVSRTVCARNHRNGPER